MNLTINELVGKKVTVHWHLRKQMFSVTYKGRVVAHVDNIKLQDVSFRVQPAGHKRVLKTGVKNVHAYVHGIVNWQSTTLDTDEPTGYSKVGYNPFKKPYFCHKCNGRKVKNNVGFAVLWYGGIYV